MLPWHGSCRAHERMLSQVDLGSVKCALVVCDNQWRDSGSSEESVEEHLQAQDYLRLDSMVLPLPPPLPCLHLCGG